MRRNRTPPRRDDYRRDRHDYDRRDYRDARRDPRRLTPPRDDLYRDREEHRSGRLTRDDSPPRRDKSRDRKRERSPDRYRERERHGRDRSRDRLRDDRSNRDRTTSRDYKRVRRSESVESKRRPDSRERRGTDRERRDYSQRGPPPESNRERLAREEREKRDKAEKEAQELKTKQLERQKRLVEWKRKKEAELAQGAGRPTSSGTDVHSSAYAPSPQTPRTREGSAAPSPEPSKPFAGKFDPKAIANRARAKLDGQALDGDIKTNGHFEKKLATNGTIGAYAESNVAFRSNHTGSSLKSTTSASKAISAGFGLNKNEDAKSTTESGPAIDMGDEAANNRRLAKIPLAEGFDDSVIEEQPDDEDQGDLDEELNADDEELVAAARAAAERRAAEAMEAAKPTEAVNGDAQMVDADEDDIDPLDAYMLELDDAPQKKSTTRTNRLLEQELGFDEDGIMDAVGDDDGIEVKAKKKKKEVPTVDHSKVEYDDFRKDFYTEPQELLDMTEEEAKSLRFELDDIKVQGANVPKPVQKFAQLGLGSQVLDIIRELGFDKPTCIQAQAIPAIMSGRDVIGVAKTGSGKTVAFLLPMFRHIKDQRPLENMEGPVGLILAPTRELATQIHRECKPYLKALKLRACCAYGGAPITDQIADLKRGAEIVVSTPGRLIDLLAANSGRVINLRRVTYVVMDEADRMFDMGFEPQVQKILSNVRPDKQCVLFSATFPRKMEGLARKELKSAVQITVGGRSTVPKEITQVVKVVKEEDKMGTLLELIGSEFSADDDKRCLVFVERQDTADVLLGKLQRVGYPCVSVHGGREQIDRDQSLEDFKAGNVPIMVATSVAARGLDVKQLTLVVNFDVPSHLEDYVHRAGRTGRAGNLGTAVTLITPDQERFSLDIVKALKQSETTVPADLEKMANDFEAKVKEGTAKRYGGFGGHGLERIQAQHDAELARQRRAFRTEGEPDEDDEGEKKDKEPPHEDEIKVYAKNEEQPTAPAAAPAPKADTGIVDVNSEIKVERTEKISLPANTGGSRLDRAAAAAALINSRLGAHGTARAGASIDNRGPDAGEFHYKLEINDFPQKARWAVTNRTNVAKILESTGVSITTKGRYYKPGEEPDVGDLPKMNVLIEGDTEPQVISAVRELRRLLNEAVAMDGSEPAKAGGRYTVV